MAIWFKWRIDSASNISSHIVRPTGIRIKNPGSTQARFAEHFRRTRVENSENVASSRSFCGYPWKKSPKPSACLRFWRMEYPPSVRANWRSCLSGDGLLIGPAPSQSESVQSLPQLRSKLLDELGERPTRSAFTSLMRLSRVRNEARSAA